MSKKVTFTPKPSSNPPANADDWVNGSNPADTSSKGKLGTEQAKQKNKRFTFDVPEPLHRRVKARCAEKGVEMADEMRRILEQQFPKS